jgi:hypothetical protein
VDTNEYRNLINEKVQDAWYNYQNAERQFKAAQAKYEAANEELRKFDYMMSRERLENDR